MSRDRISINALGFEVVQDALARAPDKAQKAVGRAVRKAAVFAGRELARRTAAASEVPAKVLRERRVKISDRRTQGAAASAWIGYAPIKAAYVGALRQTPAGTYAGRHFFAGSFAATMPTGHRGVFRRVGKSRLPLSEERVKLDPVLGIVQEVTDATTARLETLLGQELHFAFNVEL